MKLPPQSCAHFKEFPFAFRLLIPLLLAKFKNVMGKLSNNKLERLKMMLVCELYIGRTGDAIIHEGTLTNGWASCGAQRRSQ